MIKNFISQKLLPYLGERFSLIQFIPLAFLFGAHAALFSQLLLHKSYDLQKVIITCIAFFLFLFRLRLFDEFKDFEHDKKHYSSRPIPRGLISLKELKPIIFIVLTVELVISMAFGQVAFLFFIAALSYSLLLFKEFFIKDWLTQHFTTYITTHEILAIFLFYYLYAISVPNVSLLLNTIFFIHSLFLTISFFSLEVARKIRPKRLEVLSRDTYTAQYGITGASVLLGILSILSFILAFKINVTIFPFYIPAAFSLLILLYVLLRFNSAPSVKNSKYVFITAIVYAVLLHIGIIIALWQAK